MAAVARNEIMSKLLTYRFKGDRYGRDEVLFGQKLGNLVMIALRDLTGSFDEAITLFQKIFDVKGVFLPATVDDVNISARTIEGKMIYGEERIDLGKYRGKRILDKVYLHPRSAEANPMVLKNIKDADIVIAGPGDLYTTILPVLIVEKIKVALIKSKAIKMFVVNVANKPFETKGYSANDYIVAIKKHLDCFPFDKVLVNTNFSPKIPNIYRYQYVDINHVGDSNGIKIIKRDIIDENFPLYHSSVKLAKTILQNI
jgi:uncharacterized cofD-like protein